MLGRFAVGVQEVISHKSGVHEYWCDITNEQLPGVDTFERILFDLRSFVFHSSDLDCSILIADQSDALMAFGKLWYTYILIYSRSRGQSRITNPIH